MFRMCGNRVEVMRYQVSYKMLGNEMTTYAKSETEANETASRFNGTVSPLSESDDAWMDGMEVADVPDTYGEAMKIYQMGESAYNAEQARIKATQVAQLRADIDFLSIMSGVSL